MTMRVATSFLIISLSLSSLAFSAIDLNNEWEKISSTLQLSPEWEKVYSQLFDSKGEGINDKYYAFISKPTINATLKQLNELISSDFKSKPLSGMPIAVKDNIMTKHSLYPSYSGSTAFRDLNFSAPKNAEIISQFIGLGAIIFGKTNMHEFAFGVTSCNQGFGCCVNPIDESRICGGSSGGTAAAIKAGFVTFGLGTDTGGSVRMPAAATNIIGYVPTQDRYSTEGVFPLMHTTDTVGFMTNNINEIIITDWILIQDKNESCTLNMKEFYDSIDITNLRVGVPKIHFQHDVHANILKSFNGVLDLMDRHNSFTLIDGNDECFDDLLLDQCRRFEAGTLFFDILGYEYPREAAQYLNIYDSNIHFRQLLQHSTGFERDLMLSFLEENRVGVVQYHKQIENVRKLKSIFLDYFAENNLDIMVYPTLTVEPPLRNSNEKVDFELIVSKIPQNTVPTALAQIPCITIPGVKIKESKFVAGFEMCSTPNADEKLLKVASLLIDIINES